MNNNQQLNPSRQLLASLVISCLAPLAAALPEDNQQPINIQANRATQQSQDSGEKTEYFGDVVMTQGSLLLNADHVTLHSVNRKITSIVAVGNPAKLQQQSDPEKAPVKARANNIDYQLTTETIVLTENAHIEQPDAVFSGNHIEYNVATEEVIAEERVNMTFTPATGNGTSNAPDSKDTNGEAASQ